MSYEHNDCRRLLLKDSIALEPFLIDLDNVLSPKRVQSERTDRLTRYVDIVNDLDELRCRFPELEVSVDSSSAVLKVACLDELGEQQFLWLTVREEGGLVLLRHSLPNLPELQRATLFPDALEAVSEFRRVLSGLGEYLHALADLDSACWVIDPATPTARDDFRRIVIGDDLSCVITIDPRGAEPRVLLLGPSRLVEPLRLRLRPWDSSLSVPRALLQVLGLDSFPQAEQATSEAVIAAKDEGSPECAVCLEPRGLTGLLPDVTCGGLCRRYFHADCLYQWLSSVASSVRRFGVLHGACPACSAPVCCPLPGDH